MTGVPLGAEELIVAGLFGGDDIDLDVQPYLVRDSKQGMHPHEVVGPDGKLILTSGSAEYAKDFAFCMNVIRRERFKAEKKAE